VVVDDLDVVSGAITPHETDPVLLVDPDAVLTVAISLQPFQAVSGRDSEIGERFGGIQHEQLSERDSRKAGRNDPGSLAVEELLGLLIPEAPDHFRTITFLVINVKRYAPRRRGEGFPKRAPRFGLVRIGPARRRGRLDRKEWRQP
jgi:hypothetical protein